MPQQLSPRSTTVVRAVAGERRQRVDATPASMPVAAPSAGPASRPDAREIRLFVREGRRGHPKLLVHPEPVEDFPLLDDTTVREPVDDCGRQAYGPTGRCHVTQRAGVGGVQHRAETTRSALAMRSSMVTLRSGKAAAKPAFRAM